MALLSVEGPYFQTFCLKTIDALPKLRSYLAQGGPEQPEHSGALVPSTWSEGPHLLRGHRWKVQRVLEPSGTRLRGCLATCRLPADGAAGFRVALGSTSA